MVRFDLGLFHQGQRRVAKFKSAYNSLIKMLFIFKTMLVVLLWWIHLASGYTCVLGLVPQVFNKDSEMSSSSEIVTYLAFDKMKKKSCLS